MLPRHKKALSDMKSAEKNLKTRGLNRPRHAKPWQRCKRTSPKPRRAFPPHRNFGSRKQAKNV